MITMVLGGLWHGAAWSCVIWGAIHGLALSVNRMVERMVGPGRLVPALGGALGIGLTLLVVFLAWVPFRAESLGDAVLVWQGMLGLRAGGPETLSAVAFLIPLLVVIDSVVGRSGKLGRYARHWVMRTPSLYWAAMGCLVALALALYPLKSAPFVYFQF